MFLLKENVSLVNSFLPLFPIMLFRQYSSLVLVYLISVLTCILVSKCDVNQNMFNCFKFQDVNTNRNELTPPETGNSAEFFRATQVPSPIPPTGPVPERNDIRFTSVINTTSTSTEEDGHSDDLQGPGEFEGELQAGVQFQGPLTYEETIIQEAADQLDSLRVS